MPILGPDGKLLQPPATARYKPSRLVRWQDYRDLPIFTFRMIQWMLRDSTVRLGLAMRMAPLQQAEFAYKQGDTWMPGIQASSPEVADFVLKQVQRFWKHELSKMLTAQIWGWSAAEVLYRLRDDKVHFDRTLHRHARDVVALERAGKLAGVKFERVPPKGEVKLLFPKCYWHSFNSESESPYGWSILFGAYSPWADKQLEGGACSVRRLFMFRDAYGGAQGGYPSGTTNIDGKGQVPNRDIMREMVEQYEAGQVVTKPTDIDPNTQKESWTWDHAHVPNSPTHILQFPKDLDVEILRGMEIPDDVLTSEATGAWQGKQVPMMAFFANAERWLANVIQVLTQQILEPLVILNFGPVDFVVETKPLAEQAMEQMGEGSQEPTPADPLRASTRLGLEHDRLVGRGVLDAAQLVRAGRKLLKQNGKVSA